MIFDRENKKVIKEYFYSNLSNDYSSRIEQIERLSLIYDVLATTHFSYNKNIVYYYQAYIKQKQLKLDSNTIYNLLRSFAKEYNEISETGFVHGDINKKNILFNGETLLLCDLEPSLKQMRDNKPVLMYTQPYISMKDFLTGELTSDTDKIGFYLLCSKLLGSKISFDVNIITGLRNTYRHNKIENWYSILPFPEEELQTMSFIDLLNLAANHL